MRPLLSWIDKITETEKSDVGSCIYDVAIKPDGSELLVAAANKVFIYDCSDGTQLQGLIGHKDSVYCVRWSSDGQLFASAGADKSVILWTEQHEGSLKYCHNDAVQCIAFCPKSSCLLSCAISDYALLGEATRGSNRGNVSKQRINSRCTSCAWSSDGSLIAIGTYDGFVHLRRVDNFVVGTFHSDDAIIKIERPGGEPVFALSFSTTSQNEGEILAVCDWNQSLSFYDINGQPQGQEKQLDYDVSDMKFFNNGEFLAMVGSSKKVILYTRMGIRLGDVAQMDTWTWSIATAKHTNTVVVGCVDGTIACYSIMFSTIHGIHNDKYAYRDNMTEVVVQHLKKQAHARIRCNDLVKKISIYANKLAVQLSDRLIVYIQSSSEKDERLEYRMHERVNTCFDCAVMVACHSHIVVCKDSNLQCYDLRGMKQREWTFSTFIRYVKTIGGPSGKEMIVVGLKNGEVLKVFIDNPFAVRILKVQESIRGLDMSRNKRYLAVVQESGLCVIYDMVINQIIHQEPHCQSSSFNSDIDQLIAFEGEFQLRVTIDGVLGHQQKMIGVIVGFSGNRVFSLHMYVMSAYEIPLSRLLTHFVEQSKFDEAYKIACLGVPETDWRYLANSALGATDIVVATRSFARIKDYRALQMMSEIQEMSTRGDHDALIRAHALAFQRKFQQVADLYRSSGFENKAIELFTDLRMFEDAEEVMSTATGDLQKALMRKRADWAQDSNQPKVAAEMLISSGDLDRAVDVIIANDSMELALRVMKKLERGETQLLQRLAGYFVTKKEYAVAAKIYTSINDIKSLVAMHVNASHWNDAFALALRYPKFNADVYLPYASYLAENDQFDEAQQAFHKAGQSDRALDVLQQLTRNAGDECRFADAAYYHWLLSAQYLERAVDKPELVAKYHEHQTCADVYYAYESVHQYCHEPFMNKSSETVLNMARFVMSHMKIPNVSMVLTHYTAARLARDIGAYKLARHSLEQLSHLHIPQRYRKSVNIMTLNIRAKPLQDSDDILPICYRCALTNPLTPGLSCVHCSTPFIYSALTYESLPLVEIFLADDIEHEEALKLIGSEPPLGQATPFNPFHGHKKTDKVTLNRESLAKLEKGQVTMQAFPQPLSARYFYNVLPSIAIHTCPSCFKLFHSDDFEMAALQKGSCPFCRTNVARNSAYDEASDDEGRDNSPRPHTPE